MPTMVSGRGQGKLRSCCGRSAMSNTSSVPKMCHSCENGMRPPLHPAPKQGLLRRLELDDESRLTDDAVKEQQRQYSSSAIIHQWFDNQFSNRGAPKKSQCDIKKTVRKGSNSASVNGDSRTGPHRTIQPSTESLYATELQRRRQCRIKPCRPRSYAWRATFLRGRPCCILWRYRYRYPQILIPVLLRFHQSYEIKQVH